jgi:hypothetical protein
MIGRSEGAHDPVDGERHIAGMPGNLLRSWMTYSQTIRVRRAVRSFGRLGSDFTSP